MHAGRQAKRHILSSCQAQPQHEGRQNDRCIWNELPGRPGSVKASRKAAEYTHGQYGQCCKLYDWPFLWDRHGRIIEFGVKVVGVLLRHCNQHSAQRGRDQAAGTQQRETADAVNKQHRQQGTCSSSRQQGAAAASTNGLACVCPHWCIARCNPWQPAADNSL